MNKKIKIVYIIDVLDTDLAGTENQLIKMINGLDKRAFEVHLVCLGSHPWFEANASMLDCGKSVIELRRFKKPLTYLNFLLLVSYLRRSKPDIVHTFFPVSNIVGVFAARLAGIKTIISSRRDYGEWMTGNYLFATKIANRFTRFILANSKMVKELTDRKEKIKNGKVKVIYNGIDASSFKIIKRDNAFKKSLNIPVDNKVVGIIANFRPMKHHNIFILAANEVQKKRKDITFILIGTGPLKDQTEELARSLNISDHVFFAGAQKDIKKFLSIIDIGVNCSEGEGLSNAIMEYMSTGIPCVVSEAGGNPDLIISGFNGYTFKVDDYNELASLILKLLDDDAKRAMFIKNAYEKICSEMSLDVIISKYESFYRGIVNV